jgi:two-component system sensor histidine kinase RegB
MIARASEAQADTEDADPADGSVWLPWLVRMRWAAVVGQLLTVAVARWALGLDLRVGWLLAIVAFTAASNVVLAAFLDRLAGHASGVAAAVIALDVVLLTALLGLSGGAANPFTVLYLVHVSLAALLFGFRWSLAIAGLCAACYATIFAASAPLGWEHAEHMGHEMGHGAGTIGLHLQGMWAATVVAALILSYFVARTAAALRERDAQLRMLARAASRNEKLVALSALAAGAAHELGSPLGTIAVAASELDRAARQLPGAEALGEDARLIREQAARCREILARMSGEAGADLGEGLDPIDLSALLGAVQDRLEPSEWERISVACAAPDTTLRAPRTALAQALVNLVRNGLAAAPERSQVSLDVSVHGDRVRFEVRDGGGGMGPEVLARAGEPFFSTRPAGTGMGLGLFLSRAIAERLGGRLALESDPGRGTRAMLEVRRNPLERRTA